MGLSVDDIVAKFPTKTISPIQGEPDYATISQLLQLLYGNAASLPTTLAGGQHGHIGLIMTAGLYATLSPTAYEAPPDPGPTPVHANNASVNKREQTTVEHSEARRVFNNHANMDDALKAFVIDSIEDTYLCEMRNKYTGYLGVTTRDLFDHLLDRYGKITPADIEACKTKMNAPIDASQPIDVFFQRIDDCVQYAADGRVAFTTDQIMQTAYHAVSTSGVYTDACKEWRKKQTTDKTWATFKTFFAAEYHDHKEQQKVNHTNNNFHSTNATVDIGQALDNLALAATADRDIVAQLTESNLQLTTTNKLLTEQLQAALKQLSNQPTEKTSNQTDRHDGRRGQIVMDPKGYCWTHGYQVVMGHTSKSCFRPAKNHKKDATRTNIQGGSTYGET